MEIVTGNHEIKMLNPALLGLRQCLATESTLKMMKNAFHFTFKAPLVFKIFEFLSWLFGHEEQTAWLGR